MYKYEIILYWSNEDGFWIERARELGRPVPEPKGERLMLA